MKFTEQQIISAMKGTGGILSQVMSNLSKLTKSDAEMVTRQTLHKRINDNPILLAARESEQQVIDDLAETQIAKSIQNGDRWAVNLWAKYKGRLRGYKTAGDVTSNEQALEGNTTIVVGGEDAKILAADWQEYLKTKTRD